VISVIHVAKSLCRLWDAIGTVSRWAHTFDNCSPLSRQLDRQGPSPRRPLTDANFSLLGSLRLRRKGCRTLTSFWPRWTYLGFWVSGTHAWAVPVGGALRWVVPSSLLGRSGVAPSLSADDG